MTPTMTPYRSGQRAGRDGFPQLLHAEWTKFRTVRGWVISMVAAALLVVLVAPDRKPYRAGRGAGRDGFPQLLHAEWTKFRTVRGWVISMVAAALLVVLVA